MYASLNQRNSVMPAPAANSSGVHVPMANKDSHRIRM